MDISIGAVVIGRNEGDRLLNCLRSLAGCVNQIVYVDSGSSDNSVSAAKELGATVVELDTSIPFTAARARNMGFEKLKSEHNPTFVQFVDGDCAVQRDWVDVGRKHLIDNEKTAVVCGRRRETNPGGSVFNALCDSEWDTPVGLAKSCGGDALMRAEALSGVEGYRDGLIAGEEPELCVRLRLAGWEIWRIDAEMTLHDAAITRISQWWKRTKRAGHAFAEGAALHGAPPERHWVVETKRAVVWGGAIPIVLLLLALISPIALLGFLIYPAQIVRLAVRDDPLSRFSWIRATFTTIGKIPEAFGVLDYRLNRLRGKRTALIEYK